MLISTRTVEQTLADFQRYDATLVAIPFQNILQSPLVQHARVDPAGRDIVAAFTACAHAVRKTPFRAAGGYEQAYFYMGEEGDLAIRLLDAGHVIDVGSADPIHHMQPVRRRSYRADYYGRRNDVLFYYLRCPIAALPGRIVGTIVKGLLFGVKNGCVKATIHGLADGLKMMFSRGVPRQPVRSQVFHAFMRMKHGERYTMEQLVLLTAH